MVFAAIARCPDENAAFAAAALRHTLDECAGGKFAGTVDRFAIVIRTPRSTVDVDVLRIQAQRTRFDGIGHVAVQHSNTADTGSVCDTNATQWIIGGGGHLARTPCPMAIRVFHIVMRHRIFVMAIYIIWCFRILFQIAIRCENMIFEILLYTNRIL